MFSAHAEITGVKANHATTPLIINIKVCRLANYIVKFDLIRGNSSVGKAIRELKQVNKNGDIHLLSNLTASMAFMKFIQNERSILIDYKENGLYSSEYSKYTKKPFKKEVKQTYLVNERATRNVTRIFDPLSVYDHLRELACSGLRTNITLNVQEEKEVSQYHFEYKGEQFLQMPMGGAETILFVRKRKTSTRETSIWFNKSNHFLPIKIQQKKAGDTQAVLVAKSIDAELLE
jgi:hypothetical protein